MIEITPSILTNSIDDFKTFVKNYDLFDAIDIDVIRKPFVDNETVSIEESINILKTPNYKSLGFHLMVEDPEYDFILLNKSFSNRNLRIYFQQESDISFVYKLEWPHNWLKGICLKIDTKFKNLEFYNNFEEVQLMSIEIGAQGRAFDENVIDRIEELREMGYNKKISLDGGVNLKSAGIIRHLDIQRVSPGSYFAKASDLKLAKMKLELALNIKDNL